LEWVGNFGVAVFGFGVLALQALFDFRIRLASRGSWRGGCYVVEIVE
jgi:hypothetical protein